MTDTVREYVESLTDAERIQMILEYEQFEEGRFIGAEAKIRGHAQSLIRRLGVTGETTSRWMREVTIECLRFYAMRYLRERGEL